MTDTRHILRAAAHQVGIADDLVARAGLIRDGSNTLYRLDGGIVARIGRPGNEPAARHEIDVVRWLSSTPLSVTQPVADLTQAVVVDQRAVTWWHELPDHRPATPVELGHVLQQLHQQQSPADLGLPELDPFTELKPRIDAATWLGPDDQAWLNKHLTGLQHQWDELPTGLPHGVIHGDAWQGNVAVPTTEPGAPILLDLEHIAIGPPEWDLAPLAADHADFNRLGPDDYQAFVDGYGGYDITTWPGHRTLIDLQELRWVCFSLSKTTTADGPIGKEALHRIACLRDDIPRPWTWTAI